MRRPGAEIDLAAIQRHRAVGVDGEKGIDLLRDRARAAPRACAAPVQQRRAAPASAKPTVSAPALSNGAAGDGDV